MREKLPINMKMLVFFLAKCVRAAAKTMVVDRKNQKALALLYLASKPLRNAANSSGVPTEFATFFRLNWTFHLPPKRQLSILLNFFPLTNCFWLFLPLLVLLQRGSPCDCAPKTRDSAHGYIKCMPLHTGDPVARTDGRTDGNMCVLRHYQNFLAW